MTDTIWSKDTLLDITVNIVPLLILGFFLLFFILVAPWGVTLSLVSAMQILLIVVPFIALRRYGWRERESGRPRRRANGRSQSVNVTFHERPV